MDGYCDEYRGVFPLWCVVDILDAHDYREEVFDGMGLKLNDKAF
jgi:hypothetical protein